MTKIIGSLIFAESVEPFNRVATVVCNSAIDVNWSIVINGTDNNGSAVYPQFITVDNYQNSRAATYSIDSIVGAIAAYTKQIIAINPYARIFSISPTIGAINLYFSEQRLPISEGQKFQSAPLSSTFIITGGGTATFIVPTTWNNSNNKIHVIGPGVAGTKVAGFGQGGGGGAYARRENVSYVPGSIKNFSVGSASTDTWFDINTFLLAKAAVGVAGGSGAASIGDYTSSGGNGGSGVDQNNVGGGGAGGPNSSGSAQFNGNGGAGDGGFTGGLGGLVGGVINGTANGGGGATWTRFQDGIKFGPGGGGGGGTPTQTVGGNGGLNGGGGGGGITNGNGGLGQTGLIVIEWTP